MCREGKSYFYKATSVKSKLMNGIKECLMSWRKNSESLSSSNIQKIIDGYKVYRNYLQYGRIKSFFFLIILSLNFMLKNIR